MKKKNGRVTMELVTPTNLSALQKLWHDSIGNRPERYATFGAWADFPSEIKSDWSQQFFIFRESNAERGIGVVDRHFVADSCSIALALLPDHRGRGLGRIASRLLLRHCFENLGAHRVGAVIFATNEASLKMAKGGMTEEGRERDAVKIGGKYVDRVNLGLLRSEWDAQVAKRG